VERAFQACKSDLERSHVQHNLRLRIQRASETQTLWSTAWEDEPLPERAKQLWLPPPNSLTDALARGGRSSYHQPRDGGVRSGDDDDIEQMSNRTRKRKVKKGVNLHRDEDGYHDDERSGGGGGGALDEYEVAKRQRRLGRFDDGPQQRTPRGGGSSNRWERPAPSRVDTGDGSADIVLDYTVVGTSQTVDKKYLRLTAAPDPATVRPEPVLKQAIQMITERYESYGEERGQEQYIFLWERMKAVRQDLTVQRIRNAFTVEVYEMHARICLEFDDRVEFQQCQAQLTQLYEEGLGTAEGKREFAAYNILYNVGMGAHNNVADLMLALTAEDKMNEFICHALQVRAAEALGDYCLLFRLYASAPGHSEHVMDTFVDRARLDAVRVLLKAYAPTVPLSFLTRNLGFDADGECLAFIEDHGVVLAADADSRAVDCKASRASFVEHSISARLEEEMKEAARKAEMVPLSFS
jgi:hypothetical protein